MKEWEKRFIYIKYQYMHDGDDTMWSGSKEVYFVTEIKDYEKILKKFKKWLIDANGDLESISLETYKEVAVNKVKEDVDIYDID